MADTCSAINKIITIKRNQLEKNAIQPSYNIDLNQYLLSFAFQRLKSQLGTLFYNTLFLLKYKRKPETTKS